MKNFSQQVRDDLNSILRDEFNAKVSEARERAKAKRASQEIDVLVSECIDALKEDGVKVNTPRGMTLLALLVGRQLARRSRVVEEVLAATQPLSGEENSLDFERDVMKAYR